MMMMSIKKKRAAPVFQSTTVSSRLQTILYTVLLLTLTVASATESVSKPSTDVTDESHLSSDSTTIQLRGTILNQLQRGLNGVQSNVLCPSDPTLVRDYVWYTIEIDVFSLETLHCSRGEWDDMKTFLENELDTMDLFTAYQIETLQSHLCSEPDRRRNLQSSGTHQDSGHSDNDETDVEPTVQGERKLFFNQLILWYDLFYRGGSRCMMCRPDNRDRNSRLLGDASQPKDTTTSTLQEEDTHNDDKDDGFENANVTFSGGNYTDDYDYSTMYVTAENDTNDPFHSTDDNLNNSDSNSNSTTTERALSRCGGCFRLTAGTEGSSVTVNGKEYLDQHALWDKAYAVKMFALQDNQCLAPADRVHIFDGANPGHSRNLGIPNELCRGGGPGHGWGGKPKWKSGWPNDFPNCHKGSIRKLWTVAASNSQPAACNTGFRIGFVFRYPVTINRIGLLDVFEVKSVKVKVELVDGTEHHFYALNTGPNSFQEMGFHGVKRVKKLTVYFTKGGGKSCTTWTTG